MGNNYGMFDDEIRRVGKLGSEIDRLRAENAALKEKLARMTNQSNDYSLANEKLREALSNARAELRNPMMDGSNVPRAREILDKVLGAP